MLVAETKLGDALVGWIDEHSLNVPPNKLPILEVLPSQL